MTPHPLGKISPRPRSSSVSAEQLVADSGQLDAERGKSALPWNRSFRSLRERLQSRARVQLRE